MTETVFLAALAAILSLDITTFGQFMVSRPIVVGPLFGYLVGDIKTGLWVGMMVELIWVNAIPMGAAIPQDIMSVAILSTLWGLNTFGGQRSAMILALVLAVPAGILYKNLDIIFRYYNVRIVHWVEEGVMSGNERRIINGICIGLLLSLLKAFLFYVIFIYLGQWLMLKIFYQLSPDIVGGLEFAWRLLPLVGFGSLLIMFRSSKFPCYK
jgi:mannose/fructose/N-acetylgalactosamine-specific phosphotransferase system component IIC